MVTIGLIGCGEMGTALFTKIAEQNPDTYVCSPTRDFATIPWMRANTRKTRHPEDIFRHCSVVFLGVATPALLPLLTKFKETIVEHQPLIASMCARGSLEDMVNAVGQPTPPLFRIMPNTPCEVGAGAVAVAHRSCETPESLARLIDILEATGRVRVIDEKDFLKFTIAYSCSPAYNYMAMEAMSDAAVKLGIPRQLANTLAREGVLSACEAPERNSPEQPLSVKKLCKLRCFSR